MIVVRYADDTVVGFEHRTDAERFLASLRQRLGEFALELHPEKTRPYGSVRGAPSDRRPLYVAACSAGDNISLKQQGKR
jgi:hypothetical protein